MLEDIDLENVNYTPAHLFSDNDSSIKLAENPVHHPKTKHINVRHHHIRDHLGTDIILKYIPGENNLADTFTKPLSRDLFKKYMYILKGLNVE